MRVLVVNAGSSSLKLRLLDDHDVLEQSADLPAGPDGFDTAHLADILTSWDQPDVVGHRIVHGGTRFTQAVRIDADVERQLRELTDLAPLHQPKSLAGLDAVTALLPDTPAVACFDTAFHANLPAEAATYAIPRRWREKYGIRRYGFHGLSHNYASRRAAQLLNRPITDLRVVTCHLGAGASLAAVLAGRSVDTTMGFTPLEGLVMATRSGSVDPGLLIWLMREGGVSIEDLSDGLEHRSGLLGLSGTADMRVLLARCDDRARAAVAVYVHHLRGAIASMAAAMDGLDVLAFTGGVGERAAPVREATAAGLGFLGVVLDQTHNAQAVPDAEIGAPESAVRVFVIEAREDAEIARQVRGLLL